MFCIEYWLYILKKYWTIKFKKKIFSRNVLKFTILETTDSNYKIYIFFFVKIKKNF